VSNEPGLFLWIRLAIKHLRFLSGVALASGILTLGLVFLVPRWYVARSSILPPHEDRITLPKTTELGVSLQLESLMPFSEGVTLSDIYLAILESETVARALIERFNLQEVYKTSTLVKTRKALQSHTKVAPKKARVLEVKVEDKDPERAAMMANAYIQELDRVFRETRSSAGKRQRMFLEKRIVRVSAELDSLETNLAKIQGKQGLTAMSGSLQEVAVAAGQLVGQRMALSVEKEMLRDLGGSSPALRLVEMQLRAVEEELAKLPLHGVEVSGRLRELKIREVLFEELNHRLETARIEEARDTPAVEVLDRAVAPDRHTRPRRGLVTITGAMAGFALAFCWVAYSSSEG